MEDTKIEELSCDDIEEAKKAKGKKDFKLLSFGDEAEEEEEVLNTVSKGFRSKSKSIYDLSNDYADPASAKPSPSTTFKKKRAKTAVKKNSHKVKKPVKNTIIPDAQTIYALKKQRQMARREMERGEDSPSASESDDGSDDEDFDEPKIETLKHIETNDSEDELYRWEEEQIRKGAGVLASTHITNQTPAQTSESQNTRIDARFKVPSHLMKARQPDSKEDILKKLNDIISHKKINIESLECELYSIRTELDQSTVTLRNLEDEKQKLIAKYENQKKRLDEIIEEKSHS